MPDTPAPEEGVEGQPAPEGSPPSEPSLEDVKPPEEPEGRTVDQLAAEMHRKDEARDEKLDALTQQNAQLMQLLQGQANNQGQGQPGAQGHVNLERPFAGWTAEKIDAWMDSHYRGELDPSQEQYVSKARQEIRLLDRETAKAEFRMEQFQNQGEEILKTSWSELEQKDAAFKADVDALELEFQQNPNKFIAQWKPMVREIVHSRRVRGGSMQPSKVEEWKGEIRGDVPHMEGVPPSASRPPEGGLSPEHEKISKDTYGQDPKKVAELQKQLEAEGRLAP